MRPRTCRWPTPFLYPSGGPASDGPARKDDREMTSAAMYARVSSARQKKDETIASQTAALRGHAQRLGLQVPDEWVFEDEAHSGATLVRPALERLRDLVAGVGIDVVLCYSPDRLARKFAYQALLLEEFARAGTRVESSRARAATRPRISCWCSSRACSPSTRRPRSWSATGAARRTAPAPGRSTCSRAPRSATATSARATTLAPLTRSSSTRPRWWPNCFVATPTTGPPSRTWRAGSPARTCRLAPASIAGTGR